MRANDDSNKILRSAAWIWIGYLLAMAVLDVLLNAPVIQQMIGAAPPFQPGANGLLPGGPLPPVVHRLTPLLLYYSANGLLALVFLALTHWPEIQRTLGRAYFAILVLAISAAPIIVNVLIVPRFPPGPLSNAEGMALRQLPVLFVALALVAWEYSLAYVILFSIATAVFELSLISISVLDTRNITIFVFIAIVRTISFIAVGLFISRLVTQLRAQQESLRAANAGLTHYASILEQLTISRERNRLARELHDTLAHSLTAISVSLEAAKAYFDVDQARARQLVDTSLESTRSGVDETRRALQALRSNALDDLGLRLAIQRAAESAAARIGLDLELDLPSPMPLLSPDVEQTIYRVAQEAIENIAKHSQAKKIRVQLINAEHVTLTIEDDGIGLDPSAGAGRDHFGLVGMKERAALAGGELRIQGQKGQGTKLVLTI